MQTHSPSNSHFDEKEVGHLARWTSVGVASRVDLNHFLSTTLETNLPPWRPVPSRMAARVLGTSLQTLANWRMRDMGPRPEPMKKGYGNRIYYRPDRIAEWLSGGRWTDWQFSGIWLQQRGIPVDWSSEKAVYERIQVLEDMKLFPEVHRLWRSFRASEAAMPL